MKEIKVHIPFTNKKFLQMSIDWTHICPISIEYICDEPYPSHQFTGVGLNKYWWKVGLEHWYYDGCHHIYRLGPIQFFWENHECMEAFDLE